MIENKSIASFDRNKERDAKFDAIEMKMRDIIDDNYEATITNYYEIRNLPCTKIMREISLKK